MASIFPIFLVLVVVAALMTCVALFTPKGPQQVFVISFDLTGTRTNMSTMQRHSYSSTNISDWVLSPMGSDLSCTTAPPYW
jgi:hypothetical protein